MSDSYIRPWLSLGEARMIYDSLDEEGADGAFEIVSHWLEQSEEEGAVRRAVLGGQFERQYSIEEVIAIQDAEAADDA